MPSAFNGFFYLFFFLNTQYFISVGIYLNDLIFFKSYFIFFTMHRPMEKIRTNVTNLNIFWNHFFANQMVLVNTETDQNN